MRASLVVVFCVSVAMAAGCGSSDGGSGADGGGGGGGVSCDPFTQQGQPVASTASAAAAPAMTGGTLVEGTYVLTGNDYYNNDPNSGVLTQTLVFDSGTVKSILDDSGTLQINAGTYSTSGTGLTFDLQCPVMTSLQSQYTASPTTLIMTSPDGNTNHILTYTLK